MHITENQCAFIEVRQQVELDDTIDIVEPEVEFWITRVGRFCDTDLHISSVRLMLDGPEDGQRFRMLRSNTIPLSPNQIQERQYILGINRTGGGLS